MYNINICISSVNVGGTALSTSDYSVSGQKVTIPANKVTGNVVINVSTTLINTGGGNQGGSGDGGDTGGDYTISIYPTPSIATVSVSGKQVTNNQVKANIGDSITYTVSMNGFDTITETITVSGDETIKPWLNVTNLDVTNPIWLVDCYYNSTNTTSHPKRHLPTDLCTKDTGSGTNYVQYQSIPILTKEQLPVGSKFWIANNSSTVNAPVVMLRLATVTVQEAL